MPHDDLEIVKINLAATVATVAAATPTIRRIQSAPSSFKPILLFVRYEVECRELYELSKSERG